MATKVKNNSKKVAAKRVVKAVGAHLTAETYRVAARTGEAWMASVLGAELGEAIKGTNAPQALGQGKLPFRGEKGEKEITGKDQLKGNIAVFDSPASPYATAAVSGADFPLDGAFTRQGLVRIHMLATGKLCGNKDDQAMVDAIYAAICKRYPASKDAKPASTRTRKTGDRVVENPNPLFA